jgi:hypothetical protein
MRTIYIGFDLGDGETIANYIQTFDSNAAVSEIKDILMPDTQYAGTTIATAYAYKKNTTDIAFSPYIIKNEEDVENIHTNFKRRPSDLISIEANRKKDTLEQILDAASREWPSERLVQSQRLIEYRDQVAEFTNAVFQNSSFQERLKLVFQSADRIVVCVGHPTNWSTLDCKLYKKILQKSILGEVSYMGYPLEILVAGESRAAFLYAKYANTIKLQKNTLYLLIDVGSSTTDLTALTGDSRNSTYNSGNNYLGARIIDYQILEWFLSEVKDKGYGEEYADIIKHNPTAANALLMKCRKAKEELFSTSLNQIQIEFGSWKPLKLTRIILEDLINQPVLPVITKYLNYPETVKEQFRNKSWKQAFQAFLASEARELQNKGIAIHTILMTGSASQMPFITDIIRQVFSGCAIHPDLDPSKAISKGLALVGQSNEKSVKFQNDVHAFLEEGMPAIVGNNLPFLADQIGAVISDIICDDIIMPKLRDWKNMKYTTMKAAIDDIESNCSEKKIGELLQSNPKCRSIIQYWIINKVGADVALKLKELCNKYQVNEFTLNELNIMDISIGSNIGGAGLSKDMLASILSPADMLSSIVAVITGILVAIITPTLLGVVIGIISYISVTLAAIIFTILAAIPLWGWGILLAITGYGAAKLVSQGWDSVKDSISDKIITANLPRKVRDLVSEAKLKGAIDNKRSTIHSKIQEAMLSDSSKNKIKASISSSMEQQVKIKADEIKYVIESH